MKKSGVVGYRILHRIIRPQAAALLVETVSSVAEVLTDLPEVSISPDLDDNMIPATALEGWADYLVPGDKKD